MTVRKGVWLPMELLERVHPSQTNIFFYYPEITGQAPAMTTDVRYTHRRPTYFIVLGEPK